MNTHDGTTIVSPFRIDLGSRSQSDRFPSWNARTSTRPANPVRLLGKLLDCRIFPDGSSDGVCVCARRSLFSARDGIRRWNFMGDWRDCVEAFCGVNHAVNGELTVGGMWQCFFISLSCFRNNTTEMFVRFALCKYVSRKIKFMTL